MLREPLLDGAGEHCDGCEVRWTRESPRSRAAHTPLAPSAFSCSHVESIGTARTRPRSTRIASFGLAVADDKLGTRLRAT